MGDTDQERNATPWHEIVARLFQELLKRTNVTIQTNLRIMAGSPIADIVLIRRNDHRWTPGQRAFLPDGIRDASADHVLIEFKFTESLSRETLYQGTSYRYLYLQAQHLKPSRLLTVILSSKTPSSRFLSRFGYAESATSGVWRSENPMLDIVPILLLNQLSDARHNLFVKCFASRKAIREGALNTLLNSDLSRIDPAVEHILYGLLNIYIARQGGIPMQYPEITPEKVMEIGKHFQDSILANAPVEQRLKGLKPEERIAGLKPEERLAGLKPEERLAGLKLEDFLNALPVEDIQAYLYNRKRAH